MVPYLIRRLGQGVAVLFAMSLIVFIALYLVGDPVELAIGPDATASDIAAARSALGVDQPLWIQYGRFLWRVAHGDFGRSYAYSTSAMGLVLERMPATLELAVVALALAFLVGLPLGLWAGLAPQSLAGRAIMAGSILGYSLPTFWVGLMLIMIFSVHLGWLPTGGRGATASLLGVPLSLLTADGWRHVLMPATNLALFKVSLMVRLARAGTRDAMGSDYVRFARAKGLSPIRIVAVHVLKNILIPIVTVMGLEFGSVIAFSIVTESIFAWPGMGKLILDSIGVLDRPVIVAYLLVVVTLFITINLAVDVGYALLDPRVRLGREST